MYRLTKNQRNIIFIIGVVLIAILIVISLRIPVHTQTVPCNQATEVNELPFFDNWCIEETLPGDSLIQIENPNSFLDPVDGCWDCLTDPVFFKLTTSSANEITMHVTFNLCSNGPISNCGNMVGYYTVFDDCPENGGTVLSYPANGNNPMGECWDEFGGNDDFIVSSCWRDGCCGWSNGIYCYPSGIAVGPFSSEETNTGEPPWNFPTTEYWVTFYLEANTTYYFCIRPSGNCVGSNVRSYGCIDLEFSGPVILNVIEFDIINNQFIHNQFNPTFEWSYNLENWSKIEELGYIEGWNYYRMKADNGKYSRILTFWYEKKSNTRLRGYNILGQKIKQ